MSRVVASPIPQSSSFDNEPVTSEDKTNHNLFHSHAMHGQVDSFKVRVEEKISDSLFHPRGSQGQMVSSVPDGPLHKSMVLLSCFYLRTISRIQLIILLLFFLSYFVLICFEILM